MIRVHGHGLQQLLDDDAALNIGGLGPELVEGNLPQHARHFLELGRDI